MGLVLEVLNHWDLRPSINSTLYLCNGKSCYQQNVHNIHIHFTKTHLLSIVILFTQNDWQRGLSLTETLMAIYIFSGRHFFPHGSPSDIIMSHCAIQRENDRILENNLKLKTVSTCGNQFIILSKQFFYPEKSNPKLSHIFFYFIIIYS